jgi:sulfur-carrier protein adenylyltransferase/sulfurtransferase
VDKISMNNHLLYDRYQRQVILKGFGEAAQQKLQNARVLVAGAGGLGCPALQYLAAAGVGTIGIADDDVVSLSNLHRQPLYASSDIGLSKAERSAFYLQQLNPSIQIITHAQRISSKNALDLLADYDIIVDGTDNFAARYVINDACVLLDKPLVYGAVSQYEGQVAIFNSGDVRVHYRDLFPHPPKNDEVASCAEAGVLGVLPGIIGTMQAAETIKLITGIGQPLVNRMITYNSLSSEIYELALTAQEGTALLVPATRAAFVQTDYEWLCAALPGNGIEIDSNEFGIFIQQANTTVIDVREEGESPSMDEVECLKIPLASLMDNLSSVGGHTIIVFCQSGKRSMQAARWLLDAFGASRKIYSLRGGVIAWKQSQQNHHVRKNF